MLYSDLKASVKCNIWVSSFNKPLNVLIKNPAQLIIKMKNGKISVS